MKHTKDLTAQEQHDIITAYINKEKTTTQLAKQYGFSGRKVIQLFLMKNNIFRHKNTISQAIINQMLEEYKKGTTKKQIAKIFHICYGSVLEYLLNFPETRVIKKITEEQKQKMIQDYQSGDTITILSKKYNISQSYVKYILEQNKVFIFKGTRKYICDFDYFQNIDTEEKAYWLGFIAADGNLDKRDNVLTIRLEIKDKEHLEKFKKSIKADYPIKTGPYVSHGKVLYQSLIYIRSPKIKNDLISHGIVPNKSKILKLEKVMNNMPALLIRHFIRGYFDGDGGWSKCHNSFRFAFTASNQTNTIEQIQQIIIANCGLNPVKIYDNGSIKGLTYAGKYSCQKFYDYIYHSATIWLSRKKDKVDNYLSNVSRSCKNEPLGIY